MMFISQKLVDLIERNADKLAQQWLFLVQQHHDTPTYHEFDPDALYRRSYRVYKKLGQWIAYDTSKEDIAKDYTALGQKRREEGFALSEVIQALVITKRVLWLKVLNDGLLDTALELHRALELNNRVTLFYDRAIFYTALGYEKEA